MKTYRVTRRDGASAQITAVSFVTDGAGTRFVDADGFTVAAFIDGEIASVVDASVTFSPPAPAPATDEGAEE